jgi:hypothetical protein
MDHRFYWPVESEDQIFFYLLFLRSLYHSEESTSFLTFIKTLSCQVALIIFYDGHSNLSKKKKKNWFLHIKSFVKNPIFEKKKKKKKNSKVKPF